MDPDTYPELDDALAAIGDPEAAESSGMFVIDSLSKANWAVRKLAIYAARLSEAEAFAREESARLALYLAGERDKAQQSSSFLAGLLRRWHEDRLAEQGIDVRTVTHDEWAKARGKTERLLDGESVARRTQPEWDIDAPTLVAWAEANGREDLIRRPDPEPKRREVKAAFEPVGLTPDGGTVPVTTPDGEVVPGVWVTDGTVEFSIRPRGEQ